MPHLFHQENLWKSRKLLAALGLPGGVRADFEFEHISGLINPADCLSRHVGEPPVTKIGERDVRGLHMVVDGKAGPSADK
jgi:hypothetical protein